MKHLLQEAGFTEYETKVYLALLTLSTAKASEIAKYSGVPSNKVYECLIRLAEKGFIASLDIIPRKYKIIGVQKFRDILGEKEQSLKQLHRSVQELETQLISPLQPLEDVAVVLRGKNKIMQMLDEITPKLQQYQFNLGGNLVFSHKGARLIKEAIKKGVDFRFLVHYDPKRKKIYQQWINIGVKLRFHSKEEQKSIRFSTFDGKIARITIGKPQIQQEQNYLSFWIESPAFALLLKDQFLEMWNKAKEKI